MPGARYRAARERQAEFADAFFGDVAYHADFRESEEVLKIAPIVLARLGRAVALNFKIIQVVF